MILSKLYIKTLNLVGKDQKPRKNRLLKMGLPYFLFICEIRKESLHVVRIRDLFGIQYHGLSLSVGG